MGCPPTRGGQQCGTALRSWRRGSAGPDPDRDVAGTLALVAALAINTTGSTTGWAQVLASSRRTQGCLVARFPLVRTAHRHLPLCEDADWLSHRSWPPTHARVLAGRSCHLAPWPRLMLSGRGGPVGCRDRRSPASPASRVGLRRGCGPSASVERTYCW